MEKIDFHPITRNQKYLIFIISIVNILEFFDLFIIGFIIVILSKDVNWLLNPQQTSIILSGAGLGTVIGAITLGYLADNYGRKKIFIFCILIISISTLLSSLTPTKNWIFFTLTRFLIGLGVGGVNIISIPYIQEFIPIKKRGLLAGLSSSFIPLGLLLGSFITNILLNAINWRWILMIGFLPIILIFFMQKIPESPRYLISKKRFQEAKKSYAWAMDISINKLKNFNKLNSHYLNISYIKMIKNNFLSLSIISIGSFCFTCGSFVIQSWGQILLNKYFYFSLNDISKLFMLIAVCNLFGRLFSSWASDYIGRRLIIFIFGFIGSIGCIISAYSIKISFFLINDFYIQQLTPGCICFIGILITMTFGDGAFGVINSFGSEMFSNQVRSTCLGLGYGIGCIAKVISPFLFSNFFSKNQKPILENILISPFLIFSAIFLCGSILYLTAKETKNTPLRKN